ncbi:MAG: prenyltransferase [Candidatus Alcyoniella australis]|nr:prenyltransferase [Candidatus Alcyoniella australis]
MKKIKHWLQAIGLFRGFWLVSLIPVSTGAALAWHGGARFSAPLFALTLAGVWALHIAANLLNDYYDHINGTDDHNQVITPFSGGTRVIQQGLLPARSLRRAAIGCQVAGVLLLTLCAAISGRWSIMIWAPLGVLGGLFYSGAGLWLISRGLGELTLGAVFGPTLVSLGCYVQSGSISNAAWLAGIVFGLGASAVLTINEFPDVPADELAGKRTLVVRLGRQRGFALYATMIALMPVCILLGVGFRLFPIGCLAALIPAALGALIVARGERPLRELAKQIAASRNTIVLHVSTWALFLAGIGSHQIGR